MPSSRRNDVYYLKLDGLPAPQRMGSSLMKSIFLSISILFLLNLTSQIARAETIREVYEKGDAAYAKGDYAAAIQYYEKVTEMNPKFAPGFNALGLAQKANNAKLSEVAWYFKTAVELDPNYAEAYDNLGKAYYGLGHFDKAEEYCLKAIAIDPKYVSAKLSLAWIKLLGKGDTKEAIRYFEEVLEKGKVANAYYGLGMAYFMSDDRGRVLDCITQLRDMGENSMATQLEDMIREKRYVPNPDGGRGALVDIEPQPMPEEPQVPEVNRAPRPADSYPTGMEGTMKVRLRGKLMGNIEK